MENPVIIYERLISNATRLNVEKLVEYIEAIQEVMGQDWIDSEIVKAKKGGLELGNMHRLIYLLGCYNSWCDEAISNGRTNITAELLELMQLGANLEIVKKAMNYEKILQKLRIKELFESTVFEIEIAVAYLNVGGSVGFVKENNLDKRPDLEIKTKDGFKFYSECKAKILKPIFSWESLSKYVTKQIKDGSAQFTLEGPGILWLKFPYNQGLRKTSDILRRVESYVKPKLKPHEKRSITQVNLLVPTYQKIKEGIREGLAYHVTQTVVRHPNPCYEVPY